MTSYCRIWQTYFFIFLLVLSPSIIEATQNKILSKRDKKISSKSPSIVQKKSNSLKFSSKAIKRSSHFKSKRVLLKRKEKRVFFLAAIPIGVIIAALSSVGTAVLTGMVASFAGISISGVAIALTSIGAGLTFGSLTITAIIDAYQRDYAKRIVQLYNNQLYEKNRYCYAIKNINSIMDDQFQVLLFKNNIDELMAQDVISDVTKKNQFLEESSKFNFQIQLFWDSNKDYENLVCTKSIDLIGEASFFKNQITRINPELFKIKSKFDIFWSSISESIGQLVPFLNGIKELYDKGGKLLHLLNEVDTTSLPKLTNYIFGTFVEGKPLEHEIQKKMINVLGYNPASAIKLEGLNLDVKSFGYENVTNEFFITGEKKCEGNFACLLISVQNYSFSKQKDSFKKLNQIFNASITTSQIPQISAQIKEMAVHSVFEAIFLSNIHFSASKALVEIVKDSISTLNSVKKLKATGKEHNFAKDIEHEGKNLFTHTLGTVLGTAASKEEADPVRGLARKLLKKIDTYLNHIIESVNLLPEIVENYVNSTENKPEILQKIMLMNSHAQALTADLFDYGAKMVYSAFKIMSITLASFVVTGLGIESFVDIFGGSKQAISKIKELKGLLDKFLEKLAVIGMVLYIGRKVYTLVTVISRYNSVKKEVSVEEKLAQNYNLLLVHHVDYVIAKFVMFSVKTLKKMSDSMVDNSVINNIALSDDGKNADLGKLQLNNSFLEKFQKLVLDIAHSHPNFAVKYFNALFFSDLLKDNTAEFVKKINRIAHNIIIDGPISDVLIADDNVLNSFAFAENNPGYRMFRAYGDYFNSENSYSALIYCRGCYGNTKLSYIKFTTKFSEEKTIEFTKEFYLNSHSNPNCKDYSFVENTMTHKIGEDHEYSYFNACYKKIDPTAANNNLVSIIKEDTSVYNDYGPEYFSSKSTFSESFQASVKFACYDKIENAKAQIGSPIDTYYYTATVHDENLAKIESPCYGAIFKEKGETTGVVTLRDSFILHKVHKHRYYKALESAADESEKAALKVDYTHKQLSPSNLPLDYNVKGQSILEFIINFHLIAAEAAICSTEDKSSSYEKKLEEIFNIKSDVKSSCFHQLINELSNSLCQLQPEVEKQAEILTDEQIQSLPEEFKMVMNPKFKEEWTYAYVLSSYFDKETYLVGNCESGKLPEELMKFLSLYFSDNNETMKTRIYSEKQLILSPGSHIPTLQELKDSFIDYSISKYVGVEELFIPSFVHYVSDYPPSPLDPPSFDDENILKYSKFNKESYNFKCATTSEIRILVPLKKDFKERFYLKNLLKANGLIKVNDVDANIKLIELVTSTVENKGSGNPLEGYVIDDVPMKNIYFAEVFMVYGTCTSVSQNSIDYNKITDYQNLDFLLKKNYIPFFPRRYINGERYDPPANQLFQFPFAKDFCINFRLWVKMNYEDIKFERREFCLSFLDKDVEPGLEGQQRGLKKKRKIAILVHKKKNIHRNHKQKK